MNIKTKIQHKKAVCKIINNEFEKLKTYGARRNNNRGSTILRAEAKLH